MPATKIPKLSRNKYGVVKNANGNLYVTQTQLMMSSGSGGGSGTGGGNNPSSHVTASINQAMYDKGILTHNDIKTINGYSLIGYGDIEVTTSGSVDMSDYMTKTEMAAYVTHTDLNNASYLNQTYLNDKMSDYVTHSNLDAILSSYATKSYVNTRCAEVESSCYAYTESKTQDLSYSYIKQMFNDMIDKMIADGDLVNAAYVVTKVNESRT